MELAINGGKPARNEPYCLLQNIGEEEMDEVQKVMESTLISEFEGSHKVADFENAF